MEIEVDDLAFLGVLVFLKADGSFGLKVDSKLTDAYISLLNHHPREKWAVLKVLVNQARRICEPQFPDAESQHLKKALQTNRYFVAEGRGAVQPRRSASRRSQCCPSLSARPSSAIFRIDGLDWDAAE